MNFISSFTYIKLYANIFTNSVRFTSSISKYNSFSVEFTETVRFKSLFELET